MGSCLLWVMSTEISVDKTDKYEIYYVSYCCRMVDRGLMLDRQKIETNIAHNFFCSLALTDFNNHLIFTVVDEKN